MIGATASVGSRTGVYASIQHLQSVTSTGEVWKLDTGNNIEIYKQNAVDSLQYLIDSIQCQNAILLDEKVRNVVILTQNLMPFMIIFSIIVSVLTIVGWYWKFCDRREIVMRAKLRKKRAKK